MTDASFRQPSCDADGNLIMMTLAGDMNCDGVVNFTDLTLFIRAIKYFAGTETWPFTCPALNGDLNGDGTVTFADLSPFNAAITAGWTGPSVAYDWDAENRLVTVRPIAGTEAAGMSRVDFGYDSSWRRVRKTVTPWDEQASNWASAPSLDRKYLWSGWRMLLETDVLASGGEAVLRSFTWGLDLAGLGGAVNSLEQAGTIGGLLAVREYDLGGGPSPADPVDYVYLYDANGNVGQVVDWSNPVGQAAAAVVAHYEYDPYGGVTKAEGAYASDNAWRFSTKQWDNETGLGYWGYRYYSPSLGRWVSRDPIEEVGGLAIYHYAANASPNWSDATGLVSVAWDINIKVSLALSRTIEAEFEVRVESDDACCYCDSVYFVQITQDFSEGNRVIAGIPIHSTSTLRDWHVDNARGMLHQNIRWVLYPHQTSTGANSRGRCWQRAQMSDAPGDRRTIVSRVIIQDFETCALCFRQSDDGSWTACPLGCVTWSHVTQPTASVLGPAGTSF